MKDTQTVASFNDYLTALWAQRDRPVDDQERMETLRARVVEKIALEPMKDALQPITYASLLLQYQGIEQRLRRMKELPLTDRARTREKPSTPSGRSSVIHDKLSVWSDELTAGLVRSPASHFRLAAFYIKRIAFASESFMFQYASEKFLWPLYASGVILITLVSWPLVTSLLTKKGFVCHKVDLTAVRILLATLVLSFFLA
jgi:hypothetical protein